jgi:hypothetical protein
MDVDALADEVRLEALTDAIVSRQVNEVDEDEWQADFDWHRQEDDRQLARAVAPYILRRLRAAGFDVVARD